jgi:hypothetical protein
VDDYDNDFGDEF